MCKLAAISLDKKYKGDPLIPFALLGELLIIQCNRVNNDGTGIGICNKNNTFIKHWSEASKFVFSKQVSEYIRENGIGEPLIGHVRNATNGDKKDGHYLEQDAHPFVYGNIMGAHNGHFTNYKDILKENPELDLLGATIDTAVFFASLAQNLGNNKLNVEHLNRTIEMFTGSFSLLLHDSLQPGIIWIAKGNNPVSRYHWKDLGLAIIATSGADIEKAISGFIPRYNLYTGNGIIAPEKIDTEILESQALFKVDGTKVKKVADLSATKTTTVQHIGRSVYTSSSIFKERAEAVLELQLLLGITEYAELDISFKASDIETWWKTAPIHLYQTVSLAQEYLKNVLNIEKSRKELNELTETWKTCKSLYRLLIGVPIPTLDCYIGITLLEIDDDFHVPYYFNNLKLLKKIEKHLLSLTAKQGEDSG